MQHQYHRTSRALRDTFGSQTAPSPAIRSRCRLLTCPKVRTRRSTPAFRRSDHEGAGPEAASVRMVIRINRQQGRPAQLNIGTFAFAGPARKCRSANAFTAPQNRQRVWDLRARSAHICWVRGGRWAGPADGPGDVDASTGFGSSSEGVDCGSVSRVSTFSDGVSGTACTDARASAGSSVDVDDSGDPFMS